MRRLLPLLLLAAVAVCTPSSDRPRRFLFGLVPWGGRSCGACPPHPCGIDPAVIHGYCCGCRKFFDRAPFPHCPAQLQCPLHGGALCEDYNYMMDCCC